MSIMRQLLTEVLILALAGSGLALAIVAAAARAFHMLSKGLPRADEIRLDGMLVLYSLACAMAVTLASGLLPAIRGTRRSLSGSLAQAGRTQVSGRMPLQWTLVGVQVALSVTLLVGAGLLLRSFQALGAVVPGFDASRVLTFHISGNYGETANYNTLITRIDRTLNALRSVPGVEAAATAVAPPGAHLQYQVELRVLEGDVDPNQKMTANNRPVSAGYFEAMRTPLLAGEACRETTAYNSAVVNRSFAELYLGGSKAIGHHLAFVPPSPFVPSIEIRGIVADARDNGISHEPEPTLYGCLSAPDPTPVFLVRTRGNPMGMADILRRKMREIAPNRSMFEVMPLEQHLSDAFAENRLRTALLSLFALIAISLACVGLYGTLSYFVNIRRREVGLRLALGAMRGQIVSRFLWQALRVSMGGCLAGLCLAAAFSRLLAGMLYGITATDATTFGIVTLLVLCTTAAASLWPAARASSLEPVHVLRQE
jgi:putative ABC transport system permease protein